jgi:hypothetical protein
MPIDMVRSRALILLCVALLPFELLVSVARQKLVLAIGPVGFLFHPASGFVLGYLLFMPMRFKTNLFLMGALALYAAGIVVSGLVTGSPAFYVISTVLLGPAFISFVVAYADDDLFFLQIISAFVIGMAIWCVIFSVYFLFFTVPIILARHPNFWALPFERLFFALRLPPEALSGDLLYFKILGNYNKQSNILTLTMILANFCFVKGTWSWKVWAATSFPMAVMLLLMFSRGALLVLALISAALAFAALLRDERRGRQLTAAASMAIIFLASVSTTGFRDYWKGTGSLEQREAIVSGALSASNERFLASGEVAAASSGQGRVTAKGVETPASGWTSSSAEKSTFPTKQECSAASPERGWSFYLLGYGLGNFGPTMCRLPEGESHNAFLDAWIQGGIIGFVGYLGIFVVGLAVGGSRVLRSKLRDLASLYGLLIVFAVAALGMREYAFVYLWVQSAGGFLLAIGLVLATAPKQPALN